MAKDTVAMTIRVGRSSGWFRAQDSRASEFFADKVAEEALGSTRADRMVDAHKLQAQITKSVQSELEKAVRFAADKMIGTRSVLGHTTHFHIGRHVPGGARVPLTFEVFGVEGAATDAVPKGEGDEGGEGEEDAEGDGEAPDGLALHAC